MRTPKLPSHFGPNDGPDPPDPAVQAQLTSFLDQYFRASHGWQALDEALLTKLRVARTRLASKTATDRTRVTLKRAELTRLVLSLDLLQNLAGYRRDGYET